MRQAKKAAPAICRAPTSTIASAGDLLALQAGQDTLRFITCGSVDDGKSTLIGRLLWESQQIFDDQLLALEADSKRHGTQGKDLDLALLIDGLAAEREQGITIDVAYRFFSSPKRRFIVADSPGHEQYTRNMITAASTADVAVILVDARLGILTQTQRHANLVSLMGISHAVLAINKMDLVSFDPDVFSAIRSDFDKLASRLQLEHTATIPISALRGDNILERSEHTAWYDGPTLMGYLETVAPSSSESERFVFPVQWVNRPHPDFRGLSGTVANGRVAQGDTVRITASGHTARVDKIVTYDGDRHAAGEAEAITLVLDRDVDASRGDIITAADAPLEVTDQFEATVIWMHEDPGLIGRNYELKLATQWATASITSIKHRVDVNTGAHESCRQLAMNDIALCNLALSRPVAFDSYRASRTMGGFILIDRYSRATVAAGLISHNLRRAQNVHRQSLTITRKDRERQNGHNGKVIWFTGLSGAGKSTLANALEQELHAQGKRTYILDGDNIRQGLNKDLGFTERDRVENIRRVAEVAKLMMDAGLIVMTAFISPFRAEREMACQLIGKDNFIEVYVGTTLEICEQRDTKGLYKKARAGLLPNMTGIGSPYEAPEQPDITIDTGTTPLPDAVRTLIERINDTP
ncbi:sulfate adenylyltransferase subunit CysN [Thauera sp. CAU 1555]|uniref:Multifunctional fusion protein n=1 Tax=Thauera sedimentorum TaxID=2767595 RepID=A0ABR9B4L5_9RHOO|nr:sulfate adenylyltransferase subunit CysN [Thauera sedimentorum]MBC9070396.1 sulfate adenylyltransferase subunit CysN [Thauera sedimentorum]MBD8501316.1 sulfate adenylyltransferase subunit CysN [Thauera sedimentorum]